MKVLVFSCAILLSAELLMARQAQTEKPQDNVALAEVTGITTALATGEALANVRVTIAEDPPGRNQYVTLSDSSGLFVITGIVPGHYQVAGDKDGYYRPGRQGGDAEITLASGRSQDVAIRLGTASTISGRVVDENRKPLIGVNVEALQQVYHDGGRSMLPVGSPAHTDDNGEYRLYWLKPGKYLVRATYPSRDPAKPGETNGYAPTFYPGSMDTAATLPLTLLEGTELSAIDLTMLPLNTIHIKGSISNQVAGGPVIVPEFYLIPRDPLDINPSMLLPNQTTAAGVFELRGLIPGSFYLYPLVTFNGVTYSGREAIDVGDENIEGKAVRISPGQEVHVQIRYESGTTTVPLPVGTEVRLIPSGGTPSALAPRPAVAGTRPANLTIPNVAVGDYRVSVLPLPPGTYVESALLNGQHIETATGTVGPESQGRLDITLNTGGGMVQGVVAGSDGKPLPGARLVLAPADPARRRTQEAFKATFSDQNGGFTVESIPPGDYKLFAWDGVENDAWLDPDFLASFEDTAQAVHLDTSGTVTVLIQAAAIQGTP